MKIITNWRYYVLAVLAVAAMMAIFSEPAGEGMLLWVSSMTISKITGLALGYVFYRGVRYWGQKGKLPELIKLAKKD